MRKYGFQKVMRKKSHNFQKCTIFSVTFFLNRGGDIEKPKQNGGDIWKQIKKFEKHCN